jgi:vacuolar-type H+-ATPase subunit I/STV1
MTKIAKAFVVTNFFLSVFFLASAVVLLSNKADYKQMYAEIKFNSEKEKAKLENDVHDMKTRVGNIEDYLAQEKKVNKDVREENLQLKNDNEGLKQKNQELGISFATISSNIKEINNRLEDKDNQIRELVGARDTQKEIADEAIRDKEEALESVQRIEILLSSLQGDKAEKEKLLQRSEKELIEARQIIRSIQDSGGNIASFVKPTKAMNGIISAVSKDVQIVMISIGMDEGVQKGDQFTVYRGSQFIGKVIVEEPYKDMSAARIVKDMTVRAIQKGDMVTTRIGGGGGL